MCRHAMSRDFVFCFFFFFFQAEDGIRDSSVTGVQTCALPISGPAPSLVRSGCFSTSSVMSGPLDLLPGRCRWPAKMFFWPDRKSVVSGKSVDLGGRRIIKKKKKEEKSRTL